MKNNLKALFAKETIKMVAQITASIGIGLIIGEAINKLFPTPMAIRTKIAVVVGGIALEMLIADMTAKHIDEVIEHIWKALCEMVEIRDEVVKMENQIKKELFKNIEQKIVELKA